MAREAAVKASGLADNRVPFVQEIGPWKGHVTGSMSPDGLRGWRLDVDEAKGLHVNWWDKTGGRKRNDWHYGANRILGKGQDDFDELVSHFPRL